MNTVTTPPSTLGEVTVLPNRASSVANDNVRCGLLANYFILFWLIGTIFWGKDFAYIHVGPLYITEMALGVLLVSNLNRLRFADLFILAAVVFYVIIGSIIHESFTFAGKDIIWLPYLLFLRFFPRNFPKKFFRVVVICCFVKVAALALVPAVEVFPVQKYRDGVTILFCYLYLYIKNNGKLRMFYLLFFIAISVFIEFKTLIIIMLAAPFIMRVRTPWERWVTPQVLLVGVVVLLFMIKEDVSRTLLVASVDFLNSMAQLVKINFYLETGTSDWRADIWSRAINNLFRDNQLLFGQFPGFNFMNDAYLGRKLNLGGGQGLGVVRTGHNIVVQMMMKAGFVGVLIYGWYFFRNLADRHRVMMFYAMAVFSLALTADVLEVPSRGPLFFCLFVLLTRYKNEEWLKKTSTQQKQPSYQ